MPLPADIQLEDLAPRHEAGLAALFKALGANGDVSFFYPHLLTADVAHRLCRHAGLDQYFAVKAEGLIVGYGMLRGWDEGYAVPSLGLAVHPAHRGKGVAEALMRALIRQAKYCGSRQLRLTVDASRSRLISFFERFGFHFSPIKPGRLVGLLELHAESLSDKPRLGLCADVLISWGGGMDLIVNQLRAIKAAEADSSICLLVPGAPPTKPKVTRKTFRYVIMDIVEAIIERPRRKQNHDDALAFHVAELIARMQKIDPTIEVRYSAGLDDGLAQAAADLRLDAVYLAMRLPKPRPACALVGYVPDYQHRHLPHLFSDKEVAERDEVFGALVAASDFMVMNARAVAEDMRRFTPEPLPGLHVLPFSPNLDPEWLQDRPAILSAYAIDGPYFIVCNQFWMHKDHLTAFRAMAEVARSRPDVSLICTGGTTDYRDPTYFSKLEAEAMQLGLGLHLRFLGHIPKRDQVELLKHAVALIQPTLFEGGPGGGSTYEAVALGQRVLLSDVPVNLETDSGDVCFFPRGDHGALAQLMEAALDVSRTQCPSTVLLARSAARLRRNGEAIWASIRGAVASYRLRST
jgi:glycosyltransferase involved in cell wall biosynthesis/ribosomal protein S18 acetylase RimI-like enzyme